MTASRLRLASSGDVEALLDNLVHRMRGDVGTETALIGILRRGAPLARMLSERLGRHGATTPETGELKLERYADDLTLLHESPRLDEASLDVKVEDRHVVLVDDVLYSGESVFRAACFLRACGAKRMQIAVLCARGRPSMPVRPDFVGRQLDVGEGFVIDCEVPPYESKLGITLAPRPAV